MPLRFRALNWETVPLPSRGHSKCQEPGLAATAQGQEAVTLYKVQAEICLKSFLRTAE